MNLSEQARSVWRATFAPIRGATHAERLVDYYRDQAQSYDAFREHLLHGRRPLIDRLPTPPGTRWVELGAGTGHNLELLGDRVTQCARIDLVDLCPPLLEVARARVERHGWDHVHLHLADAAGFLPPEPADVVVLSYTLTMMPAWFDVVDQAVRMLRPGGLLGVTDFYVSRKWPDPGLARHAGWRRWFWPWALAWHDVFLSPDHLPYLRSRVEVTELLESDGPMPFLLGMRPPYYVLVGRRRAG